MTTDGHGSGAHPEWADVDVSPGARRNLPPTARLRVFSPLRAFDDADQLVIQEQASQPRAVYEAKARRALLTRIGREANDPFPHATMESFRTLHHPNEDGSTTAYYCPDQLPLRAGMAAGLLDQEVPFQLMDAVVPATAAEAHSERLQDHGIWLGDDKIFTREATWGIPLSWFSAVWDEDHAEMDDEDGVLSSVRLSVPLVLAIERTAHAANILGNSTSPLELLDEVVELYEWLSGFHPDSVLELDYGALANLVWPDETSRDLRDGLEALEEGDLMTAAVAYRRLSMRWIRVRQTGRAS